MLQRKKKKMVKGLGEEYRAQITRFNGIVKMGLVENVRCLKILEGSKGFDESNPLTDAWGIRFLKSSWQKTV